MWNAADLPLVLRGIDVDIPAGTRVGIVGRTGSGKSSLVSTLFRLVDWGSGTSGSVMIDGVRIDSLGLATLRSKLMIVPQVCHATPHELPAVNY